MRGHCTFRNEVLAKAFATQLRAILDCCKKYHKDKYAKQNSVPLPLLEENAVEENAVDKSPTIDEVYNKEAENAVADRAAKMRSVKAQKYYHLVAYVYLQSSS